MQFRNIGRAECIVFPTNPMDGRALCHGRTRPPGSLALTTWAGWSTVQVGRQVGQTTYPVNGGSVGSEGRNSHKEQEMVGGV